MGGIARYLKTHSLWFGFVAVFIALMVFLWIQYVWLCKLEQTSAIARQAALRNTLEAVASEVEVFYRSRAERTLNVPHSPFHTGELSLIADLWKKQPTDGVRRLFLVDYMKVPTGNFYVFDEAEGRLKPTPASDESLAIVIACLPWQTRVRDGKLIDSAGLQVNQQDPHHRIVLNPVTDDEDKLVGVVAMIIDETYLREKLLPSAMDKALPSFFPQEARGDLAIQIRDQERQLVLGRDMDSVPAVSLRFPFVFTDWTLGLHDLVSTPQRWARGSFMFNMSLASLLALLILSAVVLALRAANRVMRLSEMKSDFVSNVSHELRTPLASIRVFAEFLRLGRATEPEKVREYGEHIEVESHRLSRLIENILDFARIETERKSYRFESVELQGVVESVVKSFRVRLDQAGFTIALNLPAEPLPALDVDRDAMGQALCNLLDNAMKYSGDERSIEVSLSDDHGAQVIAVADHGIGIATQEQGRIFDRFHRVGTKLVHDVKGNGLGLSIVHHVVRAHGGQVQVESKHGKGSTFRISLPKQR